MKSTFLQRLLILAVVISTGILTAQETTPSLLPGPSDWRFERIDIPFDFAKDVPFKGYEELRFAPGMFDPKAPLYFTYVFALEIEDSSKLSKRKLKDFLTKYYRGLSTAVASSKELEIDSSQITIDLKKQKKKGKNTRSYTAEVIYLDTFNTGAAIPLHMDIEVHCKLRGKSYVVALVSSKPKSDAAWTQLQTIKQTVTLPQ